MSRTVGFTFLSAIVAMAALNTSLADDAVDKIYEPNMYKNAEGQTLPYRLMKPEHVEPGKSYPVVLFLHGAGERGDDNLRQLILGASNLATPENRQKYPCFVIAPQCPGDKRWVEVDWNLPAHTMPATPSAPLKLTFELLDKLVGELPVDKGRIYITGLSMGGYGTWDAIQRRPDYFAAAIPVCGGGDTAEASKLAKLPIWAFHGDKDNVVLTSRTTDMVEAIGKAGGTPKLTIYPGVGHDAWVATYSNPEVIAWLFSQKK